MNEQQIRTDLAAAFRLIHRFDWHEAVANHLSAAISDDGKRFVMNRKWMHFSKVTASNLQALDSRDKQIMQTTEAPDPSAWSIHGTTHASNPNAKVILHVHSPYATALATLKDPTILPIDNNTCRFYKRIAYDLEFGGIALSEDEGRRIGDSFGSHKALMLGNHGIATIGDSVAEAFDRLYYLEIACRTLMLAYSSGQPINVLSDDLAEQTAEGWNAFEGACEPHFEQLKSQLDDTEPDYKD